MTPNKSDILALAARLRRSFEAAGAVPVDAAVLQPADTLLDLYGEDIRGRAYTTTDALRGEQMLRPDFTVPVVQMHMIQGAEPARYTYAGEVFRRQEQDPNRTNEYVQVGFEIFDRANPAASDAEVFMQLRQALASVSLRAATGDIGILMAAVAGLNTSPARKAALTRHIWRPGRFRTLSDRFAGRTPMSPARVSLLSSADPFGDAPVIGKRRPEEIDARLQALRADLETPPLDAAELAALNAILSVRDKLPRAVDHLRDISDTLPSIRPAVARMEARNAALTEAGVDIAELDFEGSYGRTSMEYYDGFVFGFYAENQPDMPPVATGGRYDALTRRLGQGREIPAVGGVLRPGLMLELGASI